MPMEYFEQRERALLGDRFDVLYAAPQETAERGVTVSALRSSPEQFAAKADFPLEASPFCKAAFVVHQPDDLKFRPRIPQKIKKAGFGPQNLAKSR